MWSIGHCATGYLLGRAFYQTRESPDLNSDSETLPVHFKFDLTSLASLYLFSICLDIAHYQILRTLTHSLVFFFPLVIGLIWFFERRQLIRPWERLSMFVAAASHILCDWLFGGFAFAVPFSLETSHVFQWGSYLNLSVEMFLVALMYLLMWRNGDFDLKPRARYFHQAVFGGLIVLGLIQIGMIIYNDFFRGDNFYDRKVYNDGSQVWISLSFLIVQVSFVVMSIFMIRKRISK